MSTKWFVSCLLILLIFLSGFSSVSASSPARIAAGIVTNVVSATFKWLWSLRPPIKAEKTISSRSMMKFEGGYTVETVFDGSKTGIEPYLVEPSSTGELLILDSVNSNLYKISSPLTRFSRPKLVAGSAEGYTGHVDGKLRDAKMYHPKGITVDDSGNIYIADTLNMAIRKIGDSGITTIAGGKWSHAGSHIDGPSEDAKFSDDFDVVYVRKTCSLLVVDRGNQAIREIQLHESDCIYEQPVKPIEENEENFPLGVAVLIAAIFFGYMLALLKQRLQALFSSKTDLRAQYPHHAITTHPQRHLKPVRPPIIPVEDEAEYEKEDEGLFFSFGRLIINASSSMAEIMAGLLFSGFRKKKPRHQHPRHFHQLQRHPSHHGWPVQDSYIIRDEDEPPALESRTPIMTNAYPLMARESDNLQNQFRQSQTPYYARQDQGQGQGQGQGQTHKQPPPQQQQQHHQQQQQMNGQKRSTSNGKSGNDQVSETSEIVFGAVQEQGGKREAMVIKAVDFSDPVYNHHNIRPRVNYMGYSSYSY